MLNDVSPIENAAAARCTKGHFCIALVGEALIFPSPGIENIRMTRYNNRSPEVPGENAGRGVRGRNRSCGNAEVGMLSGLSPSQPASTKAPYRLANTCFDNAKWAASAAAIGGRTAKLNILVCDGLWPPVERVFFACYFRFAGIRHFF